ncbi:hypothetical protein L083_1469 [Actinoplanes sp. N902-109]|nr:hypothetical protein L083_1469 [Actinoplanes sp. N902-109]
MRNNCFPAGRRNRFSNVAGKGEPKGEQRREAVAEKHHERVLVLPLRTDPVYVSYPRW